MDYMNAPCFDCGSERNEPHRRVFVETGKGPGGYGVHGFMRDCENPNKDLWSGQEMLDRIRQSLQARLEGRNEGGDPEIMRLVDEIETKAFKQGQNETWCPICD